MRQGTEKKGSSQEMDRHKDRSIKELETNIKENNLERQFKQLTRE